MKKAFLLTVLLSLFLTFLTAGEYVVSTEHFDFIYSDETEESAAEIILIAEDCYSKLVSFFGTDPGVHLPVYFESGVKQYNAHYSAYSSSHIVMYVTAVTPKLFSNTSHSFQLTFYHELTHAFTASISNGFFSFLRSVFGDWIAPGNLYLDKSFIEGIAVYMESTEGEGRLNDPYTMTLMSEISAEGFPFTSHSDIAGGLDISPSGNLSYIAGAAFLEYLSDSYGSESVASFIRTAYLFPISTTNGIFKKAFGISIKDAWNGFIDSKTLASSPEESGNISGWGSWNNLTLDGGSLYVKDTKTASLYRYEKDGSGLGRIAFSYSSPDDLSFSPSFILSPYVGEKKRSVNILRRNGSRYTSFDDYYTGLLLSDEGVLLVTESDRNTTLEYRSLSDKSLLSSWSLGRDITLSEGVALSPSLALFILTQNGMTRLLSVDTESGELSVITLTEDIYIHSLSLNADGKLAVSYIEKDGLFTRYGEYDYTSGTFILSSNDFSGGVGYPVKDSDGTIYYVSEYIYSTRISSVSVSSLSFGEERSVSVSDFTAVVTAEEKKSLNGKKYHPLQYMNNSTLTPLSGTKGLYISDVSGLGVTMTTVDPSEKHTVMASVGYSFERKTPTMMLSYSYSDYFSTQLSAYSKDGNTFFEADVKGSYTFDLGSYNRSLTLSDTVALFSLEEGKGVVNRFSLSFMDLYPMGIGRYCVLGWGADAALDNLSPSLFLSLYVPRLIPVGNTTHLSFNLPFRLSAGVSDAVKNPAFALKGTLYLFTWEIQKSVDWLSIYLQHLDFTFTYRGSLLSKGWKYSDSYTLGVKLALTPLIGYFSSVAMSLNGSVTYTVADGFRFTWSFGLGE